MKRRWQDWIMGALSLLGVASLNAQTPPNEDGKWVDFVYELIESLDSEEDVNQLYNDLSLLLANPININSATKEELERYPFLSDAQIESLLTYRQKNEKIVDPYEIRLIPGFDLQTITYLIPFIVAEKIDSAEGKTTIRDLLNNGKHEVQMRGDASIQERKGYSAASDSLLAKNPNARYIGEPFYAYLKYSFTAKDRIQVGFLAEKDRGEPLFTNTRRGFDFYSGHIVLKNIGVINTLAFGHYRVSFGQGLIINSDFSFGKSSLASTAYKRNNGIRRHHSTDETNYLQGVAAAFNWGKGVLSAFYSIKSLDGIGTDSTITSIKTDGLHHLPREEAKRNVATIQIVGGDYTYKGKFFKVGATAMYYTFSKSLFPTPRLYNANYFKGNDNFNIGLHYEASTKGVKLFGESAVSKSGGIATLNGLLLSPTPTVQLTFLQRYYGATYHAYFSKAFGEASQVIDELGFYLNAQWAIHRQWTVSGYADVYKFSTPRYGIDSPSSGYDFQGVINYTPSMRVELTAQYRHRNKPKNVKEENESRNRIGATAQDRFKAQMRGTWGRGISTKTTVEALLFNGADGLSNSRGWIVGQSIGWKPTKLPFALDGYVALFNTDDYWSSVYSTEKSLLYTFSVPKLYGNGYRVAVNVKYEPIESLSLYLKYGRSHYFDREVIGTDLEEIEGSARDDFYLLVRWKF